MAPPHWPVKWHRPSWVPKGGEGFNRQGGADLLLGERGTVHLQNCLLGTSDFGYTSARDLETICGYSRLF